MSHECTTSSPLLQMFSSCLRLRSFDPKDKKASWKAQYEGRQHHTIRNVQKFYLDSDPAPPEVLAIRTHAHPNPLISERRTNRFLKDDVEEDDIIVLQEVLPNHSRKKQALVPIRTATKTAKTSKAEMKRMMNMMITEKMKIILIARIPSYCLLKSRRKHHSSRTFCLSGCEM